MKITDIQITRFKVPRRPFRNGELLPETTIYQTLTKVLTDAGAEGVLFWRRRPRGPGRHVA